MSGPAATRYRHADRTASRVVSGKAVVVVIDEQKLHTLNPIGTRVWELAGEGLALDEIVETVTKDYDVEEEIAERDVRRFLEELLEVGALEEQR